MHLRQPWEPGQSMFVNSSAKRIIVRAGRRGGKTLGVAIKGLVAFLKGRRVLYAAPTGEQTDRFWFEVTSALREPLEAGALRIDRTERYIEVAGTQQRIKAKTAWNADTLRGDYADLLILDEWQLMNEDTWEVVGAPMLIDNNGDAVFVYTPPSLRSAGVSKAHDPRHAAKMYEAAGKDASGRWARFHFTSHDNPHISEAGLADVLKDMSRASYRQEILAEDDELSASHLVYGAFNEAQCRIPRFEIPADWPVYSGHDFGTANPAALFLVKARYPIPQSVPPQIRPNDVIVFKEYLPGAGTSTAINVEAFKDIIKARTVRASAGGSHQEEDSRGVYGKHGWNIQEPAFPQMRPQVDRVIALMEAGKVYVFEDCVFYLSELASCAWEYDREGQRTNKIENEARYHLSACARYILSLSDFTPDTVQSRSFPRYTDNRPSEMAGMRRR